MNSTDSAVVVTGASGFIGRHVVGALPPGRALPLSIRAGDNIEALLAERCSGRDVSAVIHAGGQAHADDRNKAAAEEAHRRDNFELTVELARAAAAAGIKRFVFVSTIHVLATHSAPGRPLKGSHRPSPTSSYARAKLAAENELGKISQRGELEVAIVRPMLVYGAGVSGNLARLAAAIELGIPLPLGSIKNRRSLMNVRDLAELLVTLVDMQHLPTEPLIAADAEPVSTSELVHALAQALARPARLISVPSWILRLALTVIGQRAKAGQLLNDFEVEIADTRSATGWRPMHGLGEGLAELAAARRKSP